MNLTNYERNEIDKGENKHNYINMFFYLKGEDIEDVEEIEGIKRLIKNGHWWLEGLLINQEKKSWEDHVKLKK